MTSNVLPAGAKPRASWRGWPAERPLLLLLLVALAAPALAYQIPRAQVVDVGRAAAAPFISGFYFPEGEGAGAFRWSGATASITFPGAGARPWRLHLRVAGLRPQGPVRLAVAVNGQPLPPVELGGAMADLDFALAAGQVGPAGNVVVRLASPTFGAPPDTRQLGVQVAAARLEPDGPALALPPLPVLAGLAAFALLCYGTLRRWATPRLGAAAALLATAAGSAGVIIARGATAYNLPWAVLAAGAAWLAAGWLRDRRWWEWPGLAALGWAGWRFALRALAFGREGLPQGDFMIYFNAAQNLRIGAPLYDYAVARGMPMGSVYKYPPFFAIITAPVTTASPQVVAVIWYVLNLALLAALLFVVLRWFPAGQAGQPAPRAWYYLTILGFLLCVPLWENMIRGQPGLLILAAAILGLLALRRPGGSGGAVAAGLLLAFVTMVKVYPGILWLYWLWRRRWAAALSFVAASVVMVVVSGAVVGWQTLWLYVTQIMTVQSGAAPYPENQSLNGFVARLIVPAANVTWYTVVPFPRAVALALTLLILVAVAITVWRLGGGRAAERGRRFEAGYLAMLPLVLLIWPITWVHLYALLLPAYALLLLWYLQAAFQIGGTAAPGENGTGEHEAMGPYEPAGRRPWLGLALLLGSYFLVALGNEYTVLGPALQSGPARLLQSYKVYGALILWLLCLAQARYSRD